MNKKEIIKLFELNGFLAGYWKSGKISNGPFNYRNEAIKDAEKAFLL